MQWINGETWKSEKLRKSNWHKWFAWFPVVIGKQKKNGIERNVKVWLRNIYRKRTSDSFANEFFIYSLPEDLIEEKLYNNPNSERGIRI